MGKYSKKTSKLLSPARFPQLIPSSAQQLTHTVPVASAGFLRATVAAALSPAAVRRAGGGCEDGKLWCMILPCNRKKTVWHTFGTASHEFDHSFATEPSSERPEHGVAISGLATALQKKLAGSMFWG